MKRFMGLVLVFAMVTAATTADAQIGGLIKKKAGEVLTKKPDTAKPAPPPAPAGEAAAPSTPAPSPATPAAAPAAAPAPTPAAPTSAVSPLDVSALPIKNSANQVLRDRVRERENGDWDQLPYIPAAATAAAYKLSDSARAALVETVGAAMKTLVMSAAYLTEHDAYVKDERHGVDHGLKGVVGIDTAMKKNDLKQVEAIQAGIMASALADQVKTMPGEMLKSDLADSLPNWKKQAADPKNSQRAKFQKMVTKAQSIETVPPSDEKFKRGYVVIKSIDADGPDTEEAVYALAARAKQEQEQAAYDTYSVKAQLKDQLTKFVAIASKVNFNAPTVEKNKQTKFVNPADEKQGAIWKACFRAGQPSTAAAIKVAKAWLAEL
jgi:hypothetical protein